MQQCSASLAIIRRLDGNPTTGMCRCPCHDDKTPSLHVSTSDQNRPLLKCHAGCSQERLIDWCKQHGLWTARADFGQRQSQWERKQAEEQENSRRFHNAYAVLFAAVCYKSDHPDAQDQLLPYFKGRGIEKVPPAAMFLPQAEMSRLSDRRPELGLRSYPAMVLPIVNNKGLLRGAHVTFLTVDGKKNLRGKEGNIRRTLGLIKGGFVPVGEWPDPDRALITAEGVEDTASLAQYTGFAALASISAGNMKECTHRRETTSCNPRLSCADYRPRPTLPPHAPGPGSRPRLNRRDVPMRGITGIKSARREDRRQYIRAWHEVQWLCGQETKWTPIGVHFAGAGGGLVMNLVKTPSGYLA
jgi:hypothetical protein